MPAVQIRFETPGDATSISALIDCAFAGVPYAEGDEADLVAKLRSLGDLSVSLVAEEQGRVVGHIAFSPARPVGGTLGWFALGPIAVVARVNYFFRWRHSFLPVLSLHHWSTIAQSDAKSVRSSDSEFC